MPGTSPAIERRRPHPFGLRQGPEREQKRRHHAIERGLDHRTRIKTDIGLKRQSGLDQTRKANGQPDAQDKPKPDAKAHQNRDLHQIGGEDQPAIGPQRAQGGDGGNLALQIGTNGGCHADPANREPGKPDKDQEGPDPFDKLFHPRRGAAAVGPAQAAVGKGRFGGRLQRRQIGARGQHHAIFAVIKRAGRQKTRSRQILQPHQRARGQGKAARRAVRFAQQKPAQGEFGGAEREGVTSHQPHLGGQNRVHHRALVGQRLIQRQIAVQLNRPNQRIGPVNRLHLRQHARLTGNGHRAEIDNFRDRRGNAVKISPFLGTGEAVGEFDLRIAPQKDGALFGQARLNGRAHRAHGGNGSHAQGQAGQKHPKAAQATAQFAPGNRPCQSGRQAHAAASSTRPSTSRTIRSQRAASSGAWVTRTSVAPWRSRRAKIRSMIAAPLALSRLPVGSSARRIAGRGAAARAKATRCCSPPDIWAG